MGEHEGRLGVGEQAGEAGGRGGGVERRGLPQTSSGKLDRRALAAEVAGQGQIERASGRVAPRTAVEAQLAGIWAELLGVEAVGISDNFFGLGGHSLLLTQLAARIAATFQVQVPLRELFDARTIEAMTVAIAARQVAQEDPAEVARLLAEIQQASPDDLQSLLNAEAGDGQ